MRALPDKLILIDGQCNFCHSTVKWIEKQAKQKDFFYSNVQSELGKEIYAEYNIPATVDSVIFIENGVARLHSTAILRICKYLQFPFNLAVVFLVIPPIIRNAAYKLMAANRYRFFGKKESCELPDPGFNERVLN